MTQSQAKDNITLAPGVIDTIISIAVSEPRACLPSVIRS